MSRVSRSRQRSGSDAPLPPVPLPNPTPLSAHYYVSAGEVTPDFDLIRPSTVAGQEPDPDLAPRSAVTAFGKFILWAVVYDSMGGVDWAGIGVDAH
jgi:hypothetical protein